MNCINSSSTFLLIIDLFILINHSSQLDSNPCKDFEAKKRSIIPFEFIIKIREMEVKCKYFDENDRLEKCLLIYLKNYDKKRMAKMTKRFYISDNWNENKIVRNDSNELTKKIDLNLNDGLFFDDYFGPIEFKCNYSISVDKCISNDSAPLFDIKESEIQSDSKNKGKFDILRQIDECPKCPPCLVGKWWLNKTTPNSMEEVEKKYPNVKNGSWKPTECIQKRMRIAIVIPHRNRFAHLKSLMNILHPLLQKQQADYRIFVADQAYPKDGTIDKFNKAKLLNSAYKEIQEMWGENNATDCYIFHDVDLVPEYDTNIYRCDHAGPIRLFAAGDEWDYKRADHGVVGGICAQTGAQFEQANGFPNIYWGWGTEDEDMRYRYNASGQDVEFVERNIGHYASLELINKPDDQTNRKIKEECEKILKQWRVNNWETDGLNNLNYELRNIEFLQLYTNISIDVLMAESRGNHPCDKNLDFNEKGPSKKTFYKYKL